MRTTRARRLIGIAVVVPIALLISLIMWAFASPIGSSPDDDYHMASIWCADGNRPGLCEPGKAPNYRTVPKVLISSPACYQFRPGHPANCKLPPVSTMIDTKRGNFDATYPPVYYAVLGVFASKNIAVSVLAMRIFNSVLFVGMLTGIFLLARRHHRPALLWGGLVPLIPLGVFLIPSVNPSSWAITSAVVLWTSLVAFFDEHARGRRIALGAFAVVATVMAAGARGDAAMYSCIAAAAAIIASFRPTRRYFTSAILPVALVLVAAVFFFATGQSAVVDPGTESSKGYDLSLVLQIDLVRLPDLWAGSIGTWGLGWLDTEMPPIVSVTMVALVGFLVIWGLRTMPRHKAVAVAFMAFVLFAVPMYILFHDRVLIGQYVQPRYIFPLVIMFMTIVLSRFIRPDLSLTRLQLIVVGVILAIANSAALQTNIRRYVSGINVQGINLNHGVKWWWDIPVGPLYFWLLGTVAFSVAVVGLLVAARLTSLPASRAHTTAGSAAG